MGCLVTWRLNLPIDFLNIKFDTVVNERVLRDVRNKIASLPLTKVFRLVLGQRAKVNEVCSRYVLLVECRIVVRVVWLVSRV